MFVNLFSKYEFDFHNYYQNKFLTKIYKTINFFFISALIKAALICPFFFLQWRIPGLSREFSAVEIGSIFRRISDFIIINLQASMKIFLPIVIIPTRGRYVFKLFHQNRLYKKFIIKIYFYVFAKRGTSTSTRFKFFFQKFLKIFPNFGKVFPDFLRFFFKKITFSKIILFLNDLITSVTRKSHCLCFSSRALRRAELELRVTPSLIRILNQTPKCSKELEQALPSSTV